MTSIRSRPSLVSLLLLTAALAQAAAADVFEDWTCCPGALFHVTDPGGFIYATSGVFLFKVDLQGNTLWSVELDQLGGQRSIAEWLALDGAGNVMVAGGSSAFADQFLIQKWHSDGNLQWETQTSGAIHAFRIVTDAAGNSFVLGETPSSLEDFVVAKYAPDGTELWINVFAGGVINNPFALAVSPAGMVAAVGESNIPGNEYDMATVVYDPDGTQRWARYHTALGGGQDAAAGVDIGPDGAVYVTGWSENEPFDLDTTIIKYDANGNELWLREYSTPSGAYDLGIWLAVDSRGNVVSGGQSDGDIHILKYDPAGNLLWTARNNGGFGGENLLLHMTLGSDDSIYLTGNNGPDDMLAMKYASDGTLVWMTSDSPSVFPVYGFAIAPDSQGGTIVSATWGLIRFVEEAPGPIPCEDVRRFRSRCSAAGLLQTGIVLSDTSHTGETVEFTVDGVPHQATVDPAGRARLSLPGFAPGQHTVELTEPAACFPEEIVDC